MKHLHFTTHNNIIYANNIKAPLIRLSANTIYQLTSTIPLSIFSSSSKKDTNNTINLSSTPTVYLTPSQQQTLFYKYKNNINKIVVLGNDTVTIHLKNPNSQIKDVLPITVENSGPILERILGEVYNMIYLEKNLDKISRIFGVHEIDDIEKYNYRYVLNGIELSHDYQNIEFDTIQNGDIVYVLRQYKWNLFDI